MAVGRPKGYSSPGRPAGGLEWAGAYPTAYNPQKKKRWREPAEDKSVYSSIYPTHANVKAGADKPRFPFRGTVDWKTGTYTGGTGFEAKPAGVNVGGTPGAGADIEKERARQQAARNLKTRIGTPVWQLPQYKLPGWL